ncbi:reverse transcriptase domain-containing protein [Tanacetum coccineum]
MDLKTKLESTTKNHQASIQNLEAKFNRFADKQSARPSRSLPSSTQPNPKVGMPKYGKFLKELVSNKHKLEQISSAFLSDESSSMMQNKVPPKLGDPESFLIPCTFSKAFSCNVLADLCASINLMPYSLYAKLSLKTLKPTKMRVRLPDPSFQHPIGIAENMLVEVGKFTFPMDSVILKMEEDSKVPLILGRPFLHTADAVIRVKQKQLDLGVKTLLEETLFAEFDEFMAMNIEENSESEPESDEEEQPLEKITFDTAYKSKHLLKNLLRILN